MDSDDTQADSSLSDSSESVGDDPIKSYLSGSHQLQEFTENSKNLSTRSESSTHYNLLSRSRSVSRGEMSSSSSSCSLLAENSNQDQVVQALGNDSIQSTIDATFLNQSPMKSYENIPTPHSDSLNNHGKCLSPRVQSGDISRNQSISPARKSRSNRSSSSSSFTCCNSQNIKRISNSYNQKSSTETLVLNMRPEDLSDVSDLETERIEHDESKASKTDRDANRTRVPDDFDADKNQINEKYNDGNVRFQVDVLKKNDLVSTDIEKSVHVDHINRNSENGNEKSITDLRQKLDKKKSQFRAMEKGGKSVEKFAMGYVTEALDALSRKHDEDALDFEAEEGECLEGSKDEDIFERGHQERIKRDFVGEVEDAEELEEGEVTDEEEKRPEETEPKPICRFYTRGQCTWGMSCRFLHPGVTDKGNYTMFDMVRPVPLPHGNAGGFMNHAYHDFRSERPTHHRTPIHHVTYIPGTHHEQRVLPQMVVQEQSLPLVESAWERGLRTAKEMMRKANKRKEQDMDFEDKKMNLSLAQDDLEKDNYYIRDRASPETTPPYVLRHPVVSHYETEIYGPHGKFIRPSHGTYEEDPFGRAQRYRELPPHRMPQYEDDRRVRPAREVIVQRVDAICRSDEWNDPWMRSKSPQGRIQDMRERIEKRLLRDGRSYTSNSTYSSSTTSRSGSSSESSHSASHSGRRRFDSAHSSHKSSPVRRNLKNCLRSPSPRHRRSPSARGSGNRRHISSSPVSEKRSHSALSSTLKRKKISPSSSRKSSCPLGSNRKQRRGSTSSGSGSSDSSGSDSESSYSTSSESSSHADTPLKRVKQNDMVLSGRKNLKKVEMIRKRSQPPATETKKLAFGATAFTPDGNSTSSLINSSSKKITRREELLKQLRAVEDAIARKRSKLN